MAATTAGALKAYLEAQSLGVSVHRDQAPPNTSPPYITVQENISLTVDQAGDFGAGGQITGRELAQVDVWQPWRDPTTRSVLESYTLVPAVLRALRGANLTAAPTKVYGTRVVGDVRSVELENNLVRESITVEISRVI